MDKEKRIQEVDEEIMYEIRVVNKTANAVA